MSQQYPPSFKNCATCDYWGGSRTTDTFGQRVECDSAMAKGKCYCKSSGWASNPGRQANSSCNSWQKWCALK